MVVAYNENHMAQRKLTADILSAALEGFEAQKNRIDARIAEIMQMLNGSRPETAAPTDTGKPRKKRSAAVRRKMALAQRARFARLKQVAEAVPAVAAKPKRTMSASARRRIAAAQKKRWAAVKRAAQLKRRS
jgi:hypothetical protein